MDFKNLTYYKKIADFSLNYPILIVCRVFKHFFLLTNFFLTKKKFLKRIFYVKCFTKVLIYLKPTLYPQTKNI